MSLRTFFQPVRGWKNEASRTFQQETTYRRTSKTGRGGLLRQKTLGNINLLGIRLGCFPPQEEDLFMSVQIVEER